MKEGSNKIWMKNANLFNYEESQKEDNQVLKKSESLEFLKEEPSKKIEIFEREFWSLHEGDKFLEPLEFSNGKTQEDIVKSVTDLIKKGEKVIFLHGVCGTGKSAIALNIARVMGKTSIVVPIKSLQKQYEEEYMGKKHVIRPNGKKMKIAMITGRENHDSIIFPGVSCADPGLPDTIKITDKNREKVEEYYLENPLIENKSKNINEKQIRRISIAPANPYWSPILPASIELTQLKDAKKLVYKGMGGKDFIFYHRKPGCSYYDQYLSYIHSDVIIFNSAKYLSEVSLGRKPQTEVDIIDEADDFLDNLSNQSDLNLTLLSASLKAIVSENFEVSETVSKITKLIDLEEKNKRALGIDEEEIFHINKTKINEILSCFLENPELEAEIEIDELSYANIALQIAKDFQASFQDTYLTYRKEDDFLYVKLVTTNLAKKFNELVEGNKALVLMSGTLHSEKVLKNIFGVDNFSLVNAESINQGSIEIHRTGKEFDCKYSNLQRIENSRNKYLLALSESIKISKKPLLIHVNAFSDLPDEKEKLDPELSNLMSSEKLRNIQKEDKKGELISIFKSGINNVLFTTKCSRGIDFPGKTCNSIVFTKYPNPNVRGSFWRVLKETHPDNYWDFYNDKARREFLQKIYRALRSKDDHVYILSPDMRVLNAVKEMQN